jgi:hypothetical protein
LHIGPPIVPPWSSQAENGVQYRLYFLNELGHFARAHELYAENDEAAIEAAERVRDGKPAELWRQRRKVRSWKPSKA